MGWAKVDEDIREKIDNRMRDNGRYYYGSTYINRYPDYPSRKQTITPTVHPVIQNISRPTISTYCTNTITATPIKIVVSKPTPSKQKIGYVQRNNEHCGIEIYFYRRPAEEVLDDLKNNGWHWHSQKKCWFRKYSATNQSFAEKIIEQ